MVTFYTHIYTHTQLHVYSTQYTCTHIHIYIWNCHISVVPLLYYSSLIFVIECHILQTEWTLDIDRLLGRGKSVYTYTHMYTCPFIIYLPNCSLRMELCLNCSRTINLLFLLLEKWVAIRLKSKTGGMRKKNGGTTTAVCREI